MPDNSETNDSRETPSGDLSSEENLADAQMAAVKERPILLASVIVMGVAIVIGVLVVFGTIIYRVTASPDPEAVVAARGQFGAVDVAVPDGTSLLGTTYIEDRLSIVTSSNGVAEVIIIDTKRGLELGRVRLIPQSAATVQAAETDDPESAAPAPTASE